MPKAEIEVGFASWADGSFELIGRSLETGDEVTLYGTIRQGQSLQQIDRIFPTCVFIPATGKPNAKP